MRPVIVLFAKAPVAGRVKTRLQPAISAREAAALHDAFVRDMLAKLQDFCEVADLELHTDMVTDAWSTAPVARRLQSEGGLELKLLHAIARALHAGAPQVLIIGSDAPTLPSAHIARLLASPADIALGPADDGGYWGIACRRFDARMFDGVTWSGPDALRATVEACRRCRLAVEIGPRWFDIDTPADLERLAREPRLPAHTAAWLVRH